jgi:hypothetical protein
MVVFLPMTLSCGTTALTGEKAGVPWYAVTYTSNKKADGRLNSIFVPE